MTASVASICWAQASWFSHNTYRPPPSIASDRKRSRTPSWLTASAVPGRGGYSQARTWGGWHDHVTLVSAAHAFCTLQRLTRNPKDPAPT
ncbi:hypothetical protein [Streptomyces sp. NPDC059787]|uniref:hypothetical protein n=1 Tax=Streptomyces sp. NPDC059787 TaxID=3346947 RepID=UPI00364966CF